MVKKLLVGSGAVALLSLGTLIGGITTGLAGAHAPRQQAHQAQTAPIPTPGPAQNGLEADGPDAPVSLPTGSVSQDVAKQAAITYVQSTAPYNSQGLSATQVTVDSENGTAVYKVEFSGSNGQALEVTVSAQGSVLKADASNDGQERAGAEADGPGGPTGGANVSH